MDCFVILANHDEKGVYDLLLCLRLLESHFPRHGVPLVLFHEAPFAQHLRVVTRNRPWIQPVQLEFGPSPVPQDQWVEKNWRLGYRHMCQFFAYDWFHHPALASYRYLLRLDTDSEIHPPCPDIFEAGRKAGAVYGYVGEGTDIPCVSGGLWPLVEQLAPEMGYTAEQVRAIPARHYYQTNIELCDAQWFRGPQYTKLLSYVMADGGIYRHRWGDHIIRYIATNLMLPKQQIWRMPVRYRHQTFVSEG